MSVVKSLALGASILGSLVAPTLAGSIRASHHVPDRPHRVALPDGPLPTTLLVAPAPGATTTTAAVPTAVHAAQENLANSGGTITTTTFAGYLAAGSNAPVITSTTSSTAALGSQPILSSTSSAAVPTTTSVLAPASAAPIPSTSLTSAASAATSGHTVDAFINFGNAPYSEAQSLTTGNAQSWTQSQAVQSVYHGTPTAAQQTSFENEVLGVIQHTYNASGLAISLTTDPTQNFAHTMSVVSGASYSGNSSAIGITDVGNDGFSFIDKFGQATSPDQLAEAIGHNIAHELMHAFGIATHPDQTGTYLDAASASWSLLTNANTTFSPQAVQLLAAQNFLNGPGKEFTQGALGLSGLELLTAHHVSTCQCPYCRALRALKAAEGIGITSNSANVPEPATVALWTVGAVVGLVASRRRPARA